MKKQKTNATVTYEPVEVSKDVKISFQRAVTQKGTSIYGRIRKEDVEVGSVSYDSQGDYLIVQLKPYSLMEQEETAAVMEQAHKCVAEILNEE